jgi:glutathione-regulated potassium-efflux system ancillary protein KefC
MYPHHKDQAKYIAVAREGRAQLAEQMAKERQESAALHAAGAAYPGYGEVEHTGEVDEPAHTNPSNQNRL